MRKTTDRRDFLKTTTLAAAAAATGGLALGSRAQADSRTVHAAGSDMLRIGLVGCGGRGTGAAGNALGADPNTKLVAMADAFSDRLTTSRKALAAQFKGRVDVPDERCFVGFDSYKQLIDCGVDVVLLATSPHFRPMQLKACVEAGKHIFCEKPVAVDAAGVRSVMATSALAKQKNLNLVSGLCWRYDNAVRETMKRILDGAVGDIVAIRETYNTGTLWQRPRQPEWTEMEYQMRNWLYFTWLSGDHNVEQHIHSLDKAAWAMGDKPPVRAWGLGGRQVRTDPRFGDIFDHHAVCYEYANGVQVFSYCRQMAGCSNDVGDTFFGTKGQGIVLGNPGYRMVDAKGKTTWHFKGQSPSMYDEEHRELFAAIRSGKTINNGEYMCNSTMLAILGRMVTHTGQTITWEQAINSNEKMTPSAYTMDGIPPIVPGKDGVYPVDVPGQAKIG